MDERMTREQAVRWCMERGYGFVELDRGEIVYTHKGGIKRERIDRSSAALHERQD